MKTEHRARTSSLTARVSLFSEVFLERSSFESSQVSVCSEVMHCLVHGLGHCLGHGLGHCWVCFMFHLVYTYNMLQPPDEAGPKDFPSEMDRLEVEVHVTQ